MNKFKIGSIILLAVLFLSFYGVMAQDSSNTVFFPLIIGDVEEPTQEQSEVFVLPNHSWFLDSTTQYLHFVGEVQNNTNYTLRFVNPKLNLFDSYGNKIDTVWGSLWHTYLSNLPSGDKTCFDIMILDNEFVGWSYHKFESVDYSTDGLLTSGLSVVVDRTYIDPQWGDYIIEGNVQSNTTGTIFKEGEIIATLYDSSGVVVDCHFNDLPIIYDGQSFRFKFMSRDDYSIVDDYRLQIGIRK